MMNRTQKKFVPANKPILPDKKNFDGFDSHSVGVHEQYAQMVMVNTIGNTYYMSGDELFEYSVALHEKMKDTDPGFMARAIIYARNFGMMRMQPIVGLAYLSIIPDKTLFHAAFNKVIKTPGDLMDFVAVIGSIRQGKGLGRTVKRAINNWLTGRGSEARQDGLSQYHAIKYGGGDSGSKWTLKDVIKEAHPTPKDAIQSALFNYLTQGTVNPSLEQVNAIDQLKRLAGRKNELGTTEFATQVNALIDGGRLPYEVVTGIIKPTKEIWEHLMRQMPIFALVRHLSTLEEAGVFNTKANADWVIGQLTNPEIITRSRMLPFRFSTAYQHYNGNTAIKNALKTSLDLSLSNLDMLPGKNAFFLDVSGSMSNEYLEVGALLGIAALKKSSDATFMTFDNFLGCPDVDVKESVMANLDRSRKYFTGGGTSTGVCIAHLLGNVTRSGSSWSSGYAQQFPVSHKSNEPISVDNIVIITDEQQNAGTPVISLFRQYRKTVNPNAKLFIIDVAPYGSRLANEKEPGVTFIYGWSESVLAILQYAMQGTGTHVDQIKKMRL